MRKINLKGSSGGNDKSLGLRVLCLTKNTITSSRSRGNGVVNTGVFVQGCAVVNYKS